jgi:hypothetical protein
LLLRKSPDSNCDDDCGVLGNFFQLGSQIAWLLEVIEIDVTVFSKFLQLEILRFRIAQVLPDTEIVGMVFFQVLLTWDTELHFVF